MVSSCVELLRLRADEARDRRAHPFLLNGEVEEEHATYGELDRRARSIAARLQALSAPGARALLLYLPGLEDVAALFGCFYAGPPRCRPTRRAATRRIRV